MQRVGGCTKDICEDITKSSFFVTCVIAFCFAIAIKDWKPWVSGVFFGSMFSILNFRLLALTLEKAVNKGPRKARNYAMSRYTIRYMLTGIVLFIGFRAPYINVIAVIVGLLVVKLVIFVDQIWIAPKRKAKLKNMS
ncbi:MAG: ATP synthase subunit I [Tissierellales bacterium]|jgi:hypothetical protein|nr:ATP synthase subunit I [Tissierellales bacterium]